MGLLDLLTKEIKLTSALLNWREPAYFRLRLRNDLWIRVLAVLGAWLAASGVLLMVFASNRNPPGAAVAFGLGLVGAFPAFLLLFGRRAQASGKCWLYQENLRRDVMSADLTGGVINSTRWDYQIIDKCEIAPAERIGKSFSVMILTSDDDQVVIGIPKHIDLKKVADVFVTRQVNVTAVKNLPAEYTARLPWAIGLTATGLGVALVAFGFVLGGAQTGADRERDIVRPDSFPGSRPGFETVAPEPPNLNGGGSTTAPSQPMTTDDGRPPGTGELPGFAPPGRLGFPAGITPPGRIGVPPDAARGLPTPTSPASGVGSDSEMFGGPGGVPFRVVSPDRQAVVAIGYGMGNWAGQERVGRLTPFFDRTSPPRDGQTVVAKDGYALGALQVDAASLVDAVRLVFMRVKPDGSLDETDSYTSDWIGTPKDANIRTISGNGSPVIGLHGRGAAVLDAIGLVFLK